MTSTAEEMPTAPVPGLVMPTSEVFATGGSRRDRLAWWMVRMYQRSPRWGGPAVAGLCIASAIGYTLVVQPTSANADTVPTCLAKLATGFDCPGCGGTRAAWYLLHGDVADAARHHAVFVFAVPFLIYMYVAWSLSTAFGWRVPQFTLTPRTMSVFLAVWAVFSVLRNLPWAPFTTFYV
jgi:hypothetical protein